MGEAVIVGLQNEARREELMSHRVDDDLPNVPEVDALSSALAEQVQCQAGSLLEEQGMVDLERDRLAALLEAA